MPSDFLDEAFDADDECFPCGGEAGSGRRLQQIYRGAMTNDWRNLQAKGAKDHRRRAWPQRTGIYLGDIEGNPAGSYTFGGHCGDSELELRRTVVGILANNVIVHGGRCMHGVFCRAEHGGQPARLTMSDGSRFRFVIDAIDGGLGHAVWQLQVICALCNSKKSRATHVKNNNLQPKVLTSGIQKAGVAKPAAKKLGAAKKPAAKKGGAAKKAGAAKKGQ